MRIDELKKKLEVIWEKYNTHFEVEQTNSCTYVKMDVPDLIDIVGRVSDKVENTLDTSYLAFISLNKKIRTELFDILVEYAKTPISEREEEKRYIIPLPGLVTTDGKQQYLTHKEGRFFASKRREKLRQTWKEKDLIYVPEVYRKYAVEVEDENWEVNLLFNQ